MAAQHVESTGYGPDKNATRKTRGYVSRTPRHRTREFPQRSLCRPRSLSPFNSSFALTRQDSRPYRSDVASFRRFHDSKLVVLGSRRGDRAGQKHQFHAPDPLDTFRTSLFRHSKPAVFTPPYFTRKPSRNPTGTLRVAKTPKSPFQPTKPKTRAEHAPDRNPLTRRPQGGGGPQNRARQKTRLPAHPQNHTRQTPTGDSQSPAFPHLGLPYQTQRNYFSIRIASSPSP